MERITVKVITNTGNHWTTTINGDYNRAKEYYLGKWFNVGSGEYDKMERITSCEIVE